MIKFVVGQNYQYGNLNIKVLRRVNNFLYILPTNYLGELTSKKIHVDEHSEYIILGKHRLYASGKI